MWIPRLPAHSPPCIAPYQPSSRRDIRLSYCQWPASCQHSIVLYFVHKRVCSSIHCFGKVHHVALVGFVGDNRSVFTAKSRQPAPSVGLRCSLHGKAIWRGREAGGVAQTVIFLGLGQCHAMPWPATCACHCQILVFLLDLLLNGRDPSNPSQEFRDRSDTIARACRLSSRMLN